MDAINVVLSKIFADQARLCLFTFLLLIFSGEFGYRISRRHRIAHHDSLIKQAEIVQAAVLGLMGLLLGFTFAMSVERFNARRTLVQDEANAIATAFLRSSLLPEPARAETSALFPEYLELRIEQMKDLPTSPELLEHQAQTLALQKRLWSLAVESMADTSPGLINSYLQALNGMFDMEANRLAALRNHVPGAVWLLVMLVAGIGCWMTGYRTGILDKRSLLPLVALPIMITIVITLVADLDRPSHGLIGLSDLSFRDLRLLIEPPPSP